MRKIKDIIGQKFGRLIVIKKSHQNKEKRWFYKCVCDCGESTTAAKNQLEYGNKRSCGCLNGISHTKHGLTKSKEYRSWRGIKDRCFNENSKDYIRYGANGISVCDEWKFSFETFLNDMGKSPLPNCEIDRINNTGDYTPSNCRWATRKQNACNRSSSNIWFIKSKVFYSAMDAAKHYGVSESTIWAWCRGSNRTIKKINCNYTRRYPDGNNRV